jgi:malate dehydrogenase (decarboxylating)
MHLYRIREITARVACAIVKEAVKEDIAEGYRNTDPKELRRICNDDVRFTSDISC